MTKGKLIYFVDFDKLGELEGLDGLLDGQLAWEEMDLDSFPDKIRYKRDFIALAKALSQGFEISMSIWDRPGAAEVKMVLPESEYPDPMPSLLGRLIAASGSMDFDVRGSADSINLTLVFGRCE